MKKLINSKLPWYAVVSFLVIALVVLATGTVVWALVSLVLDEMKQRHNRLALHQQISTFLAQERQHK